MKTRKNPFEGMLDVDGVTLLVFPELPPAFIWARYPTNSEDNAYDIDVLWRAHTGRLAAWINKKCELKQIDFNTHNYFFIYEAKTKQEAIALIVMRLRLGIVDENS
jgi:hypothetical protein